jgi:ABC-type transport system substrate-binding protein
VLFFLPVVPPPPAPQNEAELQALASQWRQAGFDFQTAVLPAAQSQDAEIRATYTGLFTNNTNVGETTATQLTTSGIPSAANRWRGGNRGGWTNPEYDRLVEIYDRSLDDNTRGQTMAQMMRIFTEDVGSISLFFRTQPWPHVAALHGLQVVAPESNMSWNIHEWEFR